MGGGSTGCDWPLGVRRYDGTPTASGGPITSSPTPAGGRGTRLRPLTDDLPKCLAPVGGRPFLEYVIELYARQGIRDLALCSGYLAERIVDAVGNGSRWGVTIQHSIEPAPLGTIGALRYAAAVLHETFVLSYGDIYPAMPVARLIEKSRTVEQPA